MSTFLSIRIAACLSALAVAGAADAGESALSPVAPDAAACRGPDPSGSPGPVVYGPGPTALAAYEDAAGDPPLQDLKLIFVCPAPTTPVV